MTKINTFGTCDICHMAYWKKNLIKSKEITSYKPLGSGNDHGARLICAKCSGTMDSGEGVILPQYQEESFPIL